MNFLVGTSRLRSSIGSLGEATRWATANIVSLGRPRYVINPSRHEVFSIFLAEALAMRTPAVTSREIAENVEARVKPFTKDLVITEMR